MTVYQQIHNSASHAAGVPDASCPVCNPSGFRSGSFLEMLQAIEPDPRNLAGDNFRRAAQLVARQVVRDEPTPLDDESVMVS